MGVGQKAFNVDFLIGTTAVGTSVANVKKVGAPTLTIDTVETTTHDQSDSFRTWMSTLLDWGEVEIEFSATSAGYTALIAVAGTDDQAFGIIYPYSTPINFDFVGTMTELNPYGDGDVDGQFIGTAKFKVSGDITVT